MDGLDYNKIFLGGQVVSGVTSALSQTANQDNTEAQEALSQAQNYQNQAEAAHEDAESDLLNIRSDDEAIASSPNPYAVDGSMVFKYNQWNAGYKKDIAKDNKQIQYDDAEVEDYNEQAQRDEQDANSMSGASSALGTFMSILGFVLMCFM